MSVIHELLIENMFHQKHLSFLYYSKNSVFHTHTHKKKKNKKKTFLGFNSVKGRFTVWSGDGRKKSIHGFTPQMAATPGAELVQRWKPGAFAMSPPWVQDPNGGSTLPSLSLTCEIQCGYNPSRENEGDSTARPLLRWRA